MLIVDDDDWNQKKQYKKNHKNDKTFLTVFSFPIRLKLNAEKTARKIIDKYSKFPFTALKKIKKATKKDFKKDFIKYLNSPETEEFQPEDAKFARKTKETAFLTFCDENVIPILNSKNPYTHFYYKMPDIQKFEKIKTLILDDFNGSGVFNYLDDEIKILIKRIEANKIEKSNLWIYVYTRKPLSNVHIRKIKEFLRYQSIEGWGDYYEKKELSIDDEFFFTTHFWTFKNKNWKIKVETENKIID